MIKGIRPAYPKTNIPIGKPGMPHREAPQAGSVKAAP